MRSLVVLAIVALVLFTFIQLPVLSAKPGPVNGDAKSNRGKPQFVTITVEIVDNHLIVTITIGEYTLSVDPELPADNDTIIDGSPI